MDNLMVQAVQEKIDRAIKLDRGMKEDKKELDLIKSELQAVALEEMENRNLKYKQMFGALGSCEIAYKEKFEVDNYPLLKEILGDLLDTKVIKKEEIKFDVDSNFKKALIALYNGNYREHDIKVILLDLGLNDTKIKTAIKKLKGEYLKDKMVLENLGAVGDLEEELDAIRETKNFELVSRYFGNIEIDKDKIRRAIYIEEGLSIGLTYEN